MEKINLVAEVRSTTEKLSEVRAAKNIPAVVYGHNAENMIIKMNNSDFLRTFRKSGESHIISLEVAGGAILEEHIKDLEVKCLPADLVDAFDVDLSLLVNMGDSLRVSDLVVSDKYTVLSTSDDIVVTAAKPAKLEVIEDSAPEAPVMEGDEEKA